MDEVGEVGEEVEKMEEHEEERRRRLRMKTRGIGTVSKTEAIWRRLGLC